MTTKHYITNNLLVGTSPTQQQSIVKHGLFWSSSAALALGRFCV